MTPCELFEKVFDRVDQGLASHGLIPIENSLAGSIYRNYDLMLRYKFRIIGECHFRVQHCLMALPGVGLEDIERVRRVVEVDTAGSAWLILEREDKLAGALASRRATEVYGLEILRKIDLTKIKSRPNPEKIWDYLFYIDFVGHAEDENSERALRHLSEIVPFLRVLGSYPRHVIEEK